MKKVLITGFDPFGGESMNPAYEAVKGLQDKIGGAEIIKVEIPTVFNESIDLLEQAIDKHQPDFVICVGQAGNRFGVTPERVAINVDDARIPDNKGKQPIDHAIKTDGEPAYFSTLPVKAITEAIKKAGVPSTVSNTAGTFVCNHLMYGLLYLIDKKGLNTKGGFIHVPYASEQVLDKPTSPSLTIAQITVALDAAIKATLTNDTDLKVVGGEIS